MTHSTRPLFKILLGVYSLLLLTPFLALWAFQGEAQNFDSALFTEAQWNTAFLALGVLVLSTLWGLSFAVINSFYSFAFKPLMHALLLMPLSLPAYVLAFIYLGLFGPHTDWSQFFEIQGEIWFLIFVLSLSLTPYIYYFSNLGLSKVTQSEWETEKIINGGLWRFSRLNIIPKLLPFLLSAQILVIFETLSDFGAASVINVSVMTTMIYKMWFDLFSFAGAVQLSIKYSLIILVLLVVEWLLKSTKEGESSGQRDPLRPHGLSLPLQACVLVFVGLFVTLAFVYPGLQILIWSLQGSQWSLWQQALVSTLNTLGLGFVVGTLVVLLSVSLHIVLKQKKQNPSPWMSLSTIGYSIPGSILAVSVYSLLLGFTESISSQFLLTGLVFALVYKFLTVAMRPIGASAHNLPEELIETSNILNVSWWRRLRLFFYPYLKDSCLVALLLVMVEVMKEMPLTLMLAPSGFQTLSINIFNFTSEGEWQKAALSSLMLLIVGVTSVILMNLKRSSL
jgi:iron(III) transport system permease protein